MGRCESCRWWKPVGIFNSGDVGATCVGPHALDDVRDTLVMRRYIYVGPQYGCVHWDSGKQKTPGDAEGEEK